MTKNAAGNRSPVVFVEHSETSSSSQLRENIGRSVRAGDCASQVDWRHHVAQEDIDVLLEVLATVEVHASILPGLLADLLFHWSCGLLSIRLLFRSRRVTAMANLVEIPVPSRNLLHYTSRRRSLKRWRWTKGLCGTGFSGARLHSFFHRSEAGLPVGRFNGFHMFSCLFGTARPDPSLVFPTSVQRNAQRFESDGVVIEVSHQNKISEAAAH